MAENLIFQIIAADAFSAVFKKLTDSLGPTGKALAGVGTAVTAVAGTLFAMAKSTSAIHDKIGDLRDQTGMTTEFLSKMRVAAEFSGVSFEGLAKGAEKLQIGIGEASQGNAKASEEFKRLGISIYNANGSLKTAEDMLPEIADKMKGMSSATQKTTLAANLFGTRNTEIIRILKDGKAGLEAYGEEAKKMGQLFSSQVVANSAKFDDAMVKLKLTMQGLQHTIANAVIPTITGLAENFSNFVINNREEIIRWGTIIINVMGQVTEKIAYVIGILVDLWRFINALFNAVTFILSNFVSYFFKSLDFLVEKIQKFLKVINFGGVFDEGIESAENWRTGTGVILRSMDNQMETSAGKISEYFENGIGSATMKVDEFVEKAKTAISAMTALGTATVTPDMDIAAAGGGGGGASMIDPEAAGGGGASMIDPEAAKKFEDQLSELSALHDEYFLSENEKLEKWYEDQSAIFEGHEDAMGELYEIYREKKAELTEAEVEEYQQHLDQLNQMYSDTLDTDLQKLDSWMNTERSKHKNNAEALLKIQKIYDKKKDDIRTEEAKKEEAERVAKIQAYSSLYGSIGDLAGAFGKKGFYIAKAANLAQATNNAFLAFTTSMANTPGPPPIPFLAGVAARVAAMAQVAKIASSKPPKYHSGMTNVPREQMALVDKGERVLSPNQNKDLTDFLAKNTSNSVRVDNINILPNATNAEALLNMRKSSWDEIVETNILPALRSLNRRGLVIE